MQIWHTKELFSNESLLKKNIPPKTRLLLEFDAPTKLEKKEGSVEGGDYRYPGEQL